MMNQVSAIALFTTLVSLFPTAATAFPVQAGFYQNRDRIFQIAARGDRVCYQGFSGNRLITASVSRDRDHDGFYTAHDTREYFYQQDLETMLAGSLHDLRVYRRTDEFPPRLDPILQDCLADDDDFYEELETVG